MYCGRCGTNDDNNVITRNIEEDGDTLYISYYGVCRQCGEPLGFKEIFHLTDWDYISSDEIKKVLTNFKGYGKIIKR